MIIVSHRYDVVPGRMDEALEWVDKIHPANVKAGSHPPKVWYLRPVTGNPNRFTLVCQWASMAEFEEATNKRLANPEIQALSKELGRAGWCTGLERTISREFKEV